MTIPESQLRSYLSSRQRTLAASGKIVLIGEADFPNGKVLCADPFLLRAELTGKRLVPPGPGKAYVQMVATVAAGSRIAYAWLQLKDTIPEQWTEAMNFQVDSGLACFVDAGLAADFSTLVNTYTGNYYDDKMAAGFRQNATGNREGDWLLHDFGSGNMALCASGMGDGYYSAYWGLDTAGGASVLLIDFQVTG